MEENNVQLIHRILDGEEEAFATLVRKYQKRIHALAWRKTGDYHIAEEITQDTFLKVYRKLSTLKNPKQFDGWLYVIANRLCWNWIKRNEPKTQSLEETPEEEIEQSFFSQHESEQRKMETISRYREIVRKLLLKLPESERTVLTLHYLGEMNVNDIGKFLGVSANTIKSRLHRARNRLKVEDQLLITENLGGLQLSTDLTESIIRKIADMKPTPPVVKPLLPWAAFGAAAVLVMLLLGALNQYTALFQKPYDFEALSEPTIEIVELPINFNAVPKPTVQNIVGKGVTNDNSIGAGTHVSDTVLATDGQEFSPKRTFTPWTQANGPQGSPVYDLFASSKNDLYASTSLGIHKLANGGTTWTNMNAGFPTKPYETLLAEHRGVLYFVNTDQISASTDDGETWDTFCERPKGRAIELIITDHTQERTIMYLILQDEGIFRSDNDGKTWSPFNDEFTDKTITAAAAIGDSLFIGTNRGLYYSTLGGFRQLPLDIFKYVHSIAIFENNIYVAIGAELNNMDMKPPGNNERRIYHSPDAGFTWVDITPNIKGTPINASHNIAAKILASDKTILVFGTPTFQSIDGGQTWKSLGINMNLLTTINTPVLAANGSFYKVATPGIIRTTDSGDSWHEFMDGMFGTKVKDVVIFNNSIYVYTGDDFFRSTEDGDSWEKVRTDYGEFTPRIMSGEEKLVVSFTGSKLVVANNVLYRITPYYKGLLIFSLRLGEDVFSYVDKIYPPNLMEDGEEAKVTAEKSNNFAENLRQATKFLNTSGGFAVSDGSIYIEYERRLLKWQPDSQEVTDTGLIDNTDITYNINRGFQVAASADTVYVGKRDGRLFQSVDSGTCWRDITPNLPSSFASINDIKFVGKSVYVATDRGVLTSDTGEHWHVLTDNVGTRPIIDRFAVDGASFYGAGDMGVYRLDERREWEQLSPNVPDKIISLSANRDKLYIGTQNSGIFHTSLEEEPQEISNTATHSVGRK